MAAAAIPAIGGALAGGAKALIPALASAVINRPRGQGLLGTVGNAAQGAVMGGVMNNTPLGEIFNPKVQGTTGPTDIPLFPPQKFGNYGLGQGSGGLFSQVFRQKQQQPSGFFYRGGM